MHENRNGSLFIIEINNIHRTRHILPIPRTCIWVSADGAAGAVFCDIAFSRFHIANYTVLHARVLHGNLRNMLISTDQSQRVSQPVSQITLSQFRILPVA